MALRVLLVGLVTSLGFELPTSANVDAWARSGRAWCHTRQAEWEAPMPDDATAFATEPAGAESGAASIDADRAFAALVDDAASAFAADLASAGDAARAFDAIDVGDDLYPGVAYALNREPEREASPAVEAPEREPAPRAHRLAAAVRLTGQAVHAWFDLLRAPTVVSLNP